MRIADIRGDFADDAYTDVLCRIVTFICSGYLLRYVILRAVVAHSDNESISRDNNAQVNHRMRRAAVREAVLDYVCRQFLKGKSCVICRFAVDLMPFAEQHDLLGAKRNVVHIADIERNQVLRSKIEFIMPDAVRDKINCLSVYYAMFL